jgi:predicted nucleotidyltransferase component of viral defense system
MQKNYYQNILYPLQDKALRLIEKLPLDFYLTGGTALSRAYLNHRYSDDLDFFTNQNPDFKKQVEIILEAFRASKMSFDIAVTGESFTRILLNENKSVLKIDFVNDVAYRTGNSMPTSLFQKTDNILNILSNKLTALSRHSPKDVADLIYISLNYQFNWLNIVNEASQKDVWINAVEASKILDSFPLEKLNEIIWTDVQIDSIEFEKYLRILIADLLLGRDNSLVGKGK